MKNKLIYIILLISLLASCGDDSIFDTPKGDPYVISINKAISFPTDTIILSGNFIPTASASVYVVVGDSMRINSTDCLAWTATTIAFVVTDSIRSGKVFCILNGDTTDIFELSIKPYPPIVITEVPRGSFLMGSATGLNDELPVRNVELTRDMLVADKEISQRLYKFIMGANPSTKIENSLPVYNVEWIDAIRFCNELSKKDNLDAAYSINGDLVEWDTNSLGWRLPTEAEWEYMARAGEKYDSPSGSYSEIAWFNENSAGMPHTIGTTKANSFKLYDILGNVREWCWDYYAEDYYSSAPIVNPIGPSMGDRRVSRGGSFVEGKAFLRFSSRKIPNASLPIGFRIVRNK